MRFHPADSTLRPKAAATERAELKLKSVTVVQHANTASKSVPSPAHAPSDRASGPVSTSAETSLQMVLESNSKVQAKPFEETVKKAREANSRLLIDNRLIPHGVFKLPEPLLSSKLQNGCIRQRTLDWAMVSRFSEFSPWASCILDRIIYYRSGKQVSCLHNYPHILLAPKLRFGMTKIANW